MNFEHYLKLQQSGDLVNAEKGYKLLIKENDDVKFTFEGQKTSLHFVKEDYLVTLDNKNIVGEHNFSNLACCFLMARELFPDENEKLVEAASLFRPFQNRGAWLEKQGKSYFLDAYNANPSSMKRSLEGFK